MNEESRVIFQRLKPYCISLSAISLRAPEKSTPQLKDLQNALISIKPSSVTQNVGNYIFFPLKPLLVPGTPENVTTTVCEVLAWLLTTEWYTSGGEMSSQLIKMFVTMLTRAKQEELKSALYKTLITLFHVSGKDVNILSVRPTLAHFVTLCLDEASGIIMRLQALSALLALFEQLEGDTSASFLPGTVSSLTRTLVRANQTSSILIKGLLILGSGITRAFDGSITGFRTAKWHDATASQVIMALTPVLSHLSTSDQDSVIRGTVNLCEMILHKTDLPPAIFVETLLRLSPGAIPKKHASEVINNVDNYLNAMTRVLQGTEELRKISMLKTLENTLPLLSETSRHIATTRLVQIICDFVVFRHDHKVIAVQSSLQETDSQVDIEYISSATRDSLIDLLRACADKATVAIPLTTPERFWIAQQRGDDTYAHALAVLPYQTPLALESIIIRARDLRVAFRSELMHVLYPILALPQPALAALDAISKACEYSGTQEMLLDNADYIINSLNLAFVTLDFTPRTPYILGILVQFAPALVDLVDDVVATFFDILDDYHGYQSIVEGIFSGLAGVVIAVAKLEPPSFFREAVEDINRSASVDKSLDERFEELPEDPNSSRRIEDEDSPRDTKSYTIVLQIMQRAQIFLSHENSGIKIHILDLLSTGIPVIARNEDNFLPLVHLYWPQLVRRLEDPNPYVVAGVFKVMARTITFAGSFMRMRIKDDVMPPIHQILHPSRDRRGNVTGKQRKWEGTGRRKVAEGLQDTLKSIVEDGGLAKEERKDVLRIVEDLSKRSLVMQQVLQHAQELDELDTLKPEQT